MERIGRATIERMGALRDSPSGTAHHALQTTERDGGVMRRRLFDDDDAKTEFARRQTLVITSLASL